MPLRGTAAVVLLVLRAVAPRATRSLMATELAPSALPAFLRS